MRERQGLDRATLHFRVAPFIAASLLEIGLLAWMVYLWVRILRQFDGPRPTYRGLLLVWRRSTLAKYLPGSVWSVAAAAETAEAHGGSATSLAASFVLQAILSVVGAVTVAAMFGAASFSWVSIAVLAAGVLIVHPAVITAALRTTRRVTRAPAVAWRGTWLDGLSLLVLHIITWSAFGVAFALFFSSLVPNTPALWSTLIGLNAFAFIAGFMAFFSPAGLGVRETALVVMLAPFLPELGTRVGLAAAGRLWLVFTEIAGGALIQLVVAPARRRAIVRDGGTAPERPQVIRGVSVEVFADSAKALPAIIAACRGAQHSIAIAQLAFDADCRPVGSPADADHGPLFETIAAAAKMIDVRVLLNGGLLLDTSLALRRALAAARADRHVRLRTIKAFPQMMHAKLVVVDEREAFLMGASFVNGYWDGALHLPREHPAAPPGAGDRPLHDVAVHLTGESGSHLARWFDDMWSRAKPEHGEAAACPLGPRLASPAPRAPRTHAANSVRLLRTTPRGYASARHGVTEILDAYLEAIDRARSFIYLESQYFSARPIARAVRHALDAHPELEVVLLLNQNPDITGYRTWQDARLAESKLLGHRRVGAFSLWSTADSFVRQQTVELTQVFIHSKVAVIDDEWATIGTANLDGASLHSYGDDFSSWLGQRIFGRFRNVDLNVELLDGALGEPSTGVVRTFRADLWNRHLGISADVGATRPAAGWLSLWRAAAAANVAALAAPRGRLAAGRILPYVPTGQPRDQLRALGIGLDAASLDLRFDPGPIEVHCSPGWTKRLLPERLRAGRAR